MGQQVEILSSINRVVADGKSSIGIRIRFSDPSTTSINLRLTGLGSFSPSGVIRQKEFEVAGSELSFSVYAPSRPGTGLLLGEGIRYKLEYQPASLAQSLLFDWIPTLGLAFIIAMVLKTYAFASILIPSRSMEDTLQINDRLIADKLSYKLLGQDPRRGDIMVFRPPFESDKPLYIKRVIGLPGETVEVQGGTVFINGTPLNEDYIKEPPRLDSSEVIVGENEYLMLGDSRNNSQDSRVWGTVNRSCMEGRALVVYWPPSRIRLLSNPLQD